MTIQRTAGPLGRGFGFAITVGRLAFSINAGWYVIALRWRGLGYAQFALDPIQFDVYVAGVSK